MEGRAEADQQVVRVEGERVRVAGERLAAGAQRIDERQLARAQGFGEIGA